jgi:hypothetical protein
MRYTCCTFENATAVLAPYFQQADGYDKSAPIIAFFIPIATMEARYLGLVRAEGDRRESTSILAWPAHS